jgi:hypothetical protein
MVQVVECLPSKPKALNSIPSTTKKKKRKNKKRRRGKKKRKKFS